MGSWAPGWAVFLSGTGSNFQALLDVAEMSDVKLVVTDHPAARGIARARRYGIPVLIIQKPFPWETIFAELVRHRVNTIFLLGFMRIVPKHFLELWKNRGEIINLHPSLLPLYPGLHSIEAAYADGSHTVGVSIHHVIPEVDAGPFILQKRISSIDSTLDSCEFRVHRLEHRMVRKVVEKFRGRRGEDRGKAI